MAMFAWKAWLPTRWTATYRHSRQCACRAFSKSRMIWQSENRNKELFRLRRDRHAKTARFRSRRKRSATRFCRPSESAPVYRSFFFTRSCRPLPSPPITITERRGPVHAHRTVFALFHPGRRRNSPSSFSERRVWLIFTARTTGQVFQGARPPLWRLSRSARRRGVRG